MFVIEIHLSCGVLMIGGESVPCHLLVDENGGGDGEERRESDGVRPPKSRGRHFLVCCLCVIVLFLFSDVWMTNTYSSSSFFG